MKNNKSIQLNLSAIAAMVCATFPNLAAALPSCAQQAIMVTGTFRTYNIPPVTSTKQFITNNDCTFYTRHGWSPSEQPYSTYGKFINLPANPSTVPTGTATPTIILEQDGNKYLSGILTCNAQNQWVINPDRTTPLNDCAPAPTAALSCLTANPGQSCYWYAIFEPGYYAGTPNNSYWSTNPASYNPPIPRCTAPVPSTAPAILKNHGHLAPRCMRKYTFIKNPPYSGVNNSYHLQIQNGTAIELFPPN